MKQLMILAAVIVFTVPAMADTFGTGENAFNIDFVPISGATNPTSGIPIGSIGGFIFTGVANDYRMGTYEITNDQWNKFKNSYGQVTGNPSSAYDANPHFAGANVPTNEVSWYEAAQFVNFLNTSTNHQAAYKFTGTQGQSDYTFAIWDVSDAGYTAGNPYRNSNAFYFLPTENEWVKAAYWNGSNLQTWATIGDMSPTQGNVTSGTGWNYYTNQYATNPCGPWNVGSGSQELNGTYDMMGNVWEWNETLVGSSSHYIHGGSYISGNIAALTPSFRSGVFSYGETYDFGFRVASIPEPCTLLLLGLGGLLVRKQ